MWSVKYTVWSVNCAVSKAVKENEQRGKNGGKWRNFEAQFWVSSMECGVWRIRCGVLCNLASFCI